MDVRDETKQLQLFEDDNIIPVEKAAMSIGGYRITCYADGRIFC